MNWLRVSLLMAACAGTGVAADLVFPGGSGPGKGKHVVLVSGDEEYRSEEALPQLAKILSQRHGFKCTVLFAINPDDGIINPNRNDNIPGLEALATADLVIVALRWRDLPDDQMQHFAKYIESGKPVIGLRTATHSFNFKKSQTYAKYSYNNKEFDGGFGRQVLGETWINHHGRHGFQSTKGIFAPDAESHPIMKGIKSGEIWGPTDVYTVKIPLPGDSKPLVLGQVLVGMQPTDAPLEGAKNDPMMPVAWVKSYTTTSGKKARVFTTTMGAAEDFSNDAFRRMVVNACYWTTGLEKKITTKSDVALVGEFKPTHFGFGKFIAGRKPADYAK
jgi:type 1 glutamine amidotransferase